MSCKEVNNKTFGILCRSTTKKETWIQSNPSRELKINSLGLMWSFYSKSAQKPFKPSHPHVITLGEKKVINLAQTPTPLITSHSLSRSICPLTYLHNPQCSKQ